MKTVRYRTSGHLVRTIESENVGEAQAYLTQMDMTEYLDPPLDDAIVHIEWKLDADGSSWSVDAKSLRELTDDELEKLSSWVSGQNSDGLGEGFEQQEWAWITDGDCGDCFGCDNGYECEDEEGRMASFDWETNDCKFELVQP